MRTLKTKPGCSNCHELAIELLQLQKTATQAALILQQQSHTIKNVNRLAREGILEIEKTASLTDTEGRR